MPNNTFPMQISPWIMELALGCVLGVSLPHGVGRMRVALANEQSLDDFEQNDNLFILAERLLTRAF
ncbi:MAG: hypothetical protein KF716_24910 [Anaerolineae bacterium]|nr:hypothetical protein [Anaerolineae bacterium]